MALLSEGISVTKEQNACRPTKQGIPDVESRVLSVQWRRQDPRRDWVIKRRNIRSLHPAIHAARGSTAGC